nr:TMV resistance protein N-like [Ipomoea batatas]
MFGVPDYIMFREMLQENRCETFRSDRFQKKPNSYGKDASQIGGVSSGVPIVQIAEEEWDSFAEMEMRSAVIGRFRRNRPALEVIRVEIRASLRVLGDVQVGSLNANTVLLRFDSEDDWRRALLRNRAIIAGTTVWLSCLSPNWKQRLTFIPVWMRVEVDVCRPLLNKIWIAIGSKGDGFWQYIEYEQMPRFCSNCARFGHMRNDCWNLSDKGRRPGKAPAREELVKEVQKVRWREVGGRRSGATGKARQGRVAGDDGVIGSGSGPVGLVLDGAEMVNGVGQSKVCPARTFKQGIEKDVGLVKNGQSEKQASSGFESFIVDKKAWEEARQELYGFFTQVKKEMGQQEFEEKKGEIVEKANGKYMEKIKALAKYRGDLKSHGVVE